MRKDEILEKLDPKTVFVETEFAHDKARAKYRLEKSIVADYREFRKEVGAYVLFHIREVYGTCPFDTEYAMDIGNKQIAKFMDQQEAVDMAFGHNGGMPKILDCIAAGFKRQDKENYLQHLFEKIDLLDYNDVFELVKALHRRYSGYFPDGFPLMSPKEMMPTDLKKHLNDYMKFLMQHKKPFKI
jgi:hypothetical protein